MSLIRAITFDLDDTLWPVAPVIDSADMAVHRWFRENAPAVARRFHVDDLRRLRVDTGLAHPELAHDLSRLRRLSLQRACREAGVDEALAEPAFQAFFSHRQRVTLFPGARSTLESLSSRYPLAALSNGNADISRTGLDGVFRFSLSAIEVGAAKPDPRMFEEAARRLELRPAEIMHVGDDPLRDVAGALEAGCRAVLLDRSGRYARFVEAPVIRSIEELLDQQALME
ncbi:HAD family hydrolase [Natronospira bacteriovora]|uniref:HAD-IA family hydrolase n=1 Tax=Natronospira bacteriovora TaxID=3069753 RepID=A0ABU0WB97_9GAMM|nr:HAD-IA family hydrolase [Natronospira sp. AB-CW4]MDQ2070215.1 HAD-IA family hydrolase [Natronospira sp. AB-CW4]